MKLALLIGIDYINTSSQLYGCINDVSNVKSVLTEHYDYDPNNITVLTDRTERKPTRDNILTELYELILKSHREDVTDIFIGYSGHGTRTRDTSGDEKDGYDEMIVPLDFKLIRDDHLYRIIQLLNYNCRCFCLFDSCHSGSVLDLGYQVTPATPNEDGILVSTSDNSPSPTQDKVQKETEDGFPSIMISGCKDNQYSQECWVGQIQGAMTTAFLFLLQEYEYDISYEKMIYEMNKLLKVYAFSQIPILSSSSSKFDLSQCLML